MKRHPTIIRHLDSLREAKAEILLLRAKLERRDEKIGLLFGRVQELTASLKRERQINRELSTLNFAAKQDSQKLVRIRRAIERKNASL